MRFFNLTEQHSKVLLHSLQLLYMCTLCDSTNINTIIEFVPCLWHISGDGFNGGSDSYLQFRDTHAHLSLETVYTTFEWNCQMVVVSRIWCGIAAGQLYPDNHFERPITGYVTYMYFDKLIVTHCQPTITQNQSVMQ